MASELETLLTLQEHDSALERLLHRHQTLPERDALAVAETRANELDARLAVTRGERDRLAREEKEIRDRIAHFDGGDRLSRDELYDRTS